MSAAIRLDSLAPSDVMQRFEAADIDAAQFDHEAHVYVGWLYVQAYPLATAVGRFENALKGLVARLGAVGKYHVTLTWFFLLLISDRAQAEESWETFRARNSELLSEKDAVLARYYNRETLFSQHAREHFVLPDRLEVF